MRRKLAVPLEEYCQQRIECFLKARKTFPAEGCFSLDNCEWKALKKLIGKYRLSGEEQLLMAIALIPSIDPGFFSQMIIKNSSRKKELRQCLACGKTKVRGELIPTTETFLFLCGGADKAKREKAEKVLAETRLVSDNVLSVKDFGGKSHAEKVLTVPLKVRKNLFTEENDLSGTDPLLAIEKLEPLKISAQFAFPEKTLSELEKAKKSMRRRLAEDRKEGKKLFFSRILFCGFSEKEQNSAVMSLAERLSRTVYRLDLSMVVSKFIGETEKNLERLFDRAESNDWILFFDEADDLFARRSCPDNSVSRRSLSLIDVLFRFSIEHNVSVIFSVAKKSSVPDFFRRRFEHVIEFYPSRIL